MTDIQSLTQSVLQTTQVDRIQDQQQRQAGVDQRVAGHQFSQRVDQRRSQVPLADRVESDALSADGDGKGASENASGESQEEPARDPSPAEPDLGQSIDLKA